MLIEPTITWVPSGFSGYIWLDTKIVFFLKVKCLNSLAPAYLTDLGVGIAAVPDCSGLRFAVYNSSIYLFNKFFTFIEMQRLKFMQDYSQCNMNGYKGRSAHEYPYLKRRC